MVINMRLILIIVGSLLIIIENRNEYEQYYFKDGDYVGEAFLHLVFVKIKNDSAYIDWIYLQKEPRDFVSDTIITSRSHWSFQGKFCTIYKKKTEIYVRTNQSWHSDRIIESKLKSDAKAYKNLDRYKNIAYLYKEELKMKSEYSNKSMFEIHNLYLEKYELVKKATKLIHKDFIEEFLKFKTELSKEF
jgi:hypothetical protein